MIRSHSFYLPIVGISSDQIRLCREWFTTDLERSDVQEQTASHQTAQSLRDRLETCDDRAIFVDICHEAWDFLSSNEYIRSTFGFTLPPRFPSETTDAMSRILLPCFTLKQFLRNKQRNSVGTGSSAIYCGPVGIGKTTIMVVSCVIFMLFLDKYVIPVYWEFFKTGQEQRTPLQLLSTEINQSFENVHQIFQYVQRDLKKGIVFFADEFHKLYETIPGDADEETKKTIRKTIEWSKEVVGQIASLGKDMHCFGVAAGSSRNTARWALHPTTCGFRGYTSLNHSVYREIKVHPVRRKDQFLDMIDMFEFGECSEEGTLQLFLLSGGVGRVLTSLRDASVEPNKFTEMPALPNLFYEDPALHIIISEMFLTVCDAVRKAVYDPWCDASGVDIARVNEIIAKIHGADQRGVKLADYMENSILIESQTDPGFIELLYPGMLYAVDNLCKASFDGYELMDLEGILTGSSRSSNCNGPSPSDGHKCEMLMLRMIADYNLLQEVPEGHLLVFDRQLPCLSHKFSLLDPLVNWHIRWFDQTFEGVDAVVFSTFDNKNFDMYYIQLKMGRVDKSIKDPEIARILKKASNGLDKVMEMIDKRGKCKVNIKEFLLLTSKNVETSPECMLHKGKRIPMTTVAGDDFLEKLPNTNGLRDRISAWR
jgi:hypothetical protein